MTRDSMTESTILRADCRKHLVLNLPTGPGWAAFSAGRITAGVALLQTNKALQDGSQCSDDKVRRITCTNKARGENKTALFRTPHR